MHFFNKIHLFVVLNSEESMFPCALSMCALICIVTTWLLMTRSTEEDEVLTAS